MIVGAKMSYFIVLGCFMKFGAICLSGEGQGLWGSMASNFVNLVIH